jgi:protein-S-isoprenylcysteine O-methyltransferase Ste14
MTMFLGLLFYYLAFFALTFIWPIWRFWRREGINPLVFANADGAYGFVVFWFKLLIVAVFALVGALAAGLDPALFGPMSWLDLPALRWAGVTCFVLSIPIIALAQVQMGRSWRIGIDHQRKTELVTGGIFTRSRNPIFLGMRINLLGLFLFLPNGATFAIWIAAELLMGVQVRLEEAHLNNAIGTDYTDYSRKVRRWI